MSTNLSITLMGEMVVFVKVVETGSFSEAARQLGTTPSSTSRSVARLEKALATRLLNRTTRKLRLSESGEEVYRRCIDMVNAARAVMDVSGQFSQTPEGVIRLSVPKAVGRFLIHPHLPEFLRRYPQVDVHMNLSDHYVDLIDGDVDFAIRITDQPPPGLMGRELVQIDHLLAATPHYLAEHGIPEHPRELTKHSCIYLGQEPADSRWRFRKGNKTVSVNVRGRYAANHTGARLDAVLHHIGIGSLPYFTARYALRKGLIVQVLPEWSFQTQYCGGAWLLYPATRHLQPKLKVFIDFLVERLSQEPTLYDDPEIGVAVTQYREYEMPEAGGDW
ncbi:transcriptional regulator [Pseudomonas asuensis]|uniref:Transcriptional regulator n=1 Tax=Pseudomonas asuensis TaxID=1825787 RepID=A0ABQ2GXI8_9PSED|nr:LysR family transcriptional regulator [Pseudomonas asuensis]GGM16991.1 transcriptional regulator [Pseudomonas asuensis]